MIVERLCRGAAFAIALAATVDPSVTRTISVAPLVSVITSSPDPSATQTADRVTRELGRGFKVVAELATSSAATVVVGDELPRNLPSAGPVSVVWPRPQDDTRVDIDRIVAPQRLRGFARARVAIDLTAHRLAGGASVVALIQDGLEVATARRTWTLADEHARIELASAPIAGEGARLTIEVRTNAAASSDPSTIGTARADLFVAHDARPLRIFVYEPRASWAARFARRALESDDRFRVSSVTRFAPGVERTTGVASPRLSPGGLEEHDVAIVGAPEVLDAATVRLFDDFARVRGGAVLLAPDQMVRGPVLRLVPASRIDLVATAEPAEASLDEGWGIAPVRASEVLSLVDLAPAARPLATVATGAATHLVAASTPAGRGQIGIVGMLDAWRYRADPSGAFARFWTHLVAVVGSAVHDALDVSIEPGVVAPGGRAHIRVELRPTEFAVGDSVHIPLVTATLRKDDRRETIRLWPAGQPGVFVGTVTSSELGRHVVAVSVERLEGAADASSRRETSAPLLVEEDPRTAGTDGRSLLRALAHDRGGILVEESDLGRLTDHLRRAASPRLTGAAVHPMRSGWWSVPFALSLGTEWWLRRRRGER